MNPRRLLVTLCVLPASVLFGLPFARVLISSPASVERDAVATAAVFFSAAISVLAFMLGSATLVRTAKLLDDILRSRSRARPRVVRRPPGVSLLELARFCFSSKNFERVLQPIHSDFEVEYNEALAAGETGRAKMIRFRFTVTFVTNAVSLLPLKALRKIYDLAFSPIRPL